MTIRPLTTLSPSQARLTKFKVGQSYVVPRGDAWTCDASERNVFDEVAVCAVQDHHIMVLASDGIEYPLRETELRNVRLHPPSEYTNKLCTFLEWSPTIDHLRLIDVMNIMLVSMRYNA